MAVNPNTPMNAADMQALFTLANNNNLPGAPYFCLPPLRTPADQFNDLKAPFPRRNRGAYDKNTFYIPGDVVSFQTSLGDFFEFIYTSVQNFPQPDGSATIPPLKPGTTNFNFADIAPGYANGLPWAQTVDACYNRLRVMISRYVNNQGVGDFTQVKFSDWQQSVSGPWPCESPNINYDDLEFYFADTGHGATVTVQGSVNALISNGVFTISETEHPGYPPQDQNGNPINIPILQPGRLPSTSTGTNDPGPPEVSTSITTAVTGPATAQNGPQYLVRYISSATYSIVVGGDTPIPVDLTFILQIGSLPSISFTEAASGDGSGVVFSVDYGTADPTANVSVSGGWIPGADWKPVDASGNPVVGGNYSHYQSRYTGLLAPGKYSVTAKYTGNPNNRASGVLTVTDVNDGSNTTVTWSGGNTWAADQIVAMPEQMFCTGTAGYTRNAAVEVLGLHNSKKVFKIALPPFAGLGPATINGEQNWYGGDIFGNNYLEETTATNFPIAFAPTVGGSFGTVDESKAGQVPALPVAYTIIENALGDLTITADTVGYWFGKTPPIADLGILHYELMPWNQVPVDSNSPTLDFLTNTYTGSIPPYTGGQAVRAQAALAYDRTDAPDWEGEISDANELLPWPKVWKSGVFYPQGFIIIDSNGNLQKAAGAGRSGSGPPQWPFVEGTETKEPDAPPPQIESGVTWVLLKKLRPEPTWAPDTIYPFGTVVIDANGDQQQSTGWQPATFYTQGTILIDSNGNKEVCTTAGLSGAQQPNWNINLNGATNDGAAIWKNEQLNTQPTSGDQGPAWTGITQDGTVRWTRIAVTPRLTPAVARISPPIYPAYRQNGTRPAPNLTMPYVDGGGRPIWNFLFAPGSPEDPSLNGNPPQIAGAGAWIYRISLNRIPQSRTPIKPPPTGQIQVTLGVMRNGAFVAFGTYQTGQSLTANWPVFTSATALVYQASEEVDVQAEFIMCGTSYSVWGLAKYPFAAAYLNDLTTIINML